MFDWTRSWIRLRRENVAMRSGRLIDLFYDDERYVFARQHGTETVIVALNRHDRAKRVSVAASVMGLKNGTTLKSVIGVDASSRVAHGLLTFDLPPQTAVAFKAF